MPATLVEIELPALHDGQREIHDTACRFKIVRAGRRFGKTILAAVLCLQVALGVAPWHHRCHDGTPGLAWWVAPTYKVARIGWKVLVRFARQIDRVWPGVEIRKADWEIVFPNGGEIAVRSADSESGLRGEGLDFLVLEEAAYCPERAWTEDLRAALSDKQGEAVFITTPDGYNWFYDLEERMLQFDDWQLFHYPTADNPRILASELEAARRELGSIVFAQEYLAEYVEVGGNVFKRIWFDYWHPIALINEEDDEEVWWVVGDERVQPDAIRRFLIIDPAVTTKQTSDYTVMGVFGVTPNQNLMVLDWVRDRMEGPDIIPAAKRMAARWEADWVGIEAVGGFKHLVQEARRAGLAVVDLNPRDRGDKLARSLPLQARLEAGSVFFQKDALWVNELERELLVFPMGEHDDQVDVLAYAAIHVSTRRKYQAI